MKPNEARGRSKYYKSHHQLLAGLGAKRVVIRPDKENTASRKVLEANGYIYNGEYYLKEVRQNVQR